MNTNEMTADPMTDPVLENGPSVDFICAISEFLDTDPQDLLVELGYHHSDDSSSAHEQAVSYHA